MADQSRWAKLKQEDIKTLGFSSYEGEVILIDWKAEKVSNEIFYFNAQEFFSKDEIANMPWFDAWLFLPID
jgi:hypothetical protein